MRDTERVRIMSRLRESVPEMNDPVLMTAVDAIDAEFEDILRDRIQPLVDLEHRWYADYFTAFAREVSKVRAKVLR